MALPLIPPVFLPVFLLIGFVILWMMIKVVEKMMFLILVISVEIGMAFVMYHFYLPGVIPIEELAIWRLYPPIFWDKVIGSLATVSADPSLIATALICLGVLYFYMIHLLRRQGILAPVIAGIILIALGVTLPGFRTFLDVMGISWLFYGVSILIVLGLIGWKILSKKKK